MKFDLTILKKYQDDGLIRIAKHPEAELFCLNYTQKVQFDKLWDEITLQCRGLILDAEMNVVAKPFGKFFNLEEHQPNEIPKIPFEVSEKMDGSLGILYWLNDTPRIATRGSFESEQSQHATHILHTKYNHTFARLERNKTYLFEIIYPQNRIVIDYGIMDDLILLTVIDNETRSETLPDIGFSTVKLFDGINDLQELKALEENNKEGFVIRFKNGFRIKMKFAEYVRLHRIITGVSNIALWEYLSEGKSIQELLEKVPDEFYNWVKKTQDELTKQFEEILTDSKAVFKRLDTRKETALYFQTQKHPSVLFALLDEKLPDKIIWKMIKPKYSKPFKIDQQ